MELEDEIASFYTDMLRFAKLQLRDAGVAEDVVQEAIAAALAGRQCFSGDASLKTWIFSILRHKIIDVIRRNKREIRFSDLLEEGEELDVAIEKQFEESGQWTQESRPNSWGDPEDSLHQEQFWAVFKACLDHLPESSARIFTMREVLDFDVDEICSKLGMSANNCYVVLYRSRMKLRQCLEQEWFVKENG
jgi:RNA polymerase sigma-70 factor, ECF subfamily